MGNEGGGTRTHALQWVGIIVVVRVRDLLWRPLPLVGRVVNVGSDPLSLVVGVVDERRGPLATAGDLLALRVWDGGGLPVTVLVLIPVLWFLCLWVSHFAGHGFVPVGWLGGLGVRNLGGSVLVPVIGLGRLGIRNLHLVHPVGWLGVGGIVNLLWGEEGWLKVLKEGALLLDDVVNEDLVLVVGRDDGGEDVGAKVAGRDPGGVLQMLLLVLNGNGGARAREGEASELGRERRGAGRKARSASRGRGNGTYLSGVLVLVPEDEVHFARISALVGSEHDAVGGLVGEVLGLELGVVGQELEVPARATVALGELDVVLENDGVVPAEGEGPATEDFAHAVTSRLLWQDEGLPFELRHAVVLAVGRRNPSRRREILAREVLEELRVLNRVG